VHGGQLRLEILYGSHDSYTATGRRDRLLCRRGANGPSVWAPADQWRLAMFDALMLVIGCGFFVAAVLYAVACEKM
jgi:hypothetical protein